MKFVNKYFKQDGIPLFTPEETRLVCSLAIQTGKEAGRDSAGLLDSIVHKVELTMGQVEQIKKKYPVGTRTELDHMEGEEDMPDGLRGTVKHVDDQGQLCIALLELDLQSSGEHCGTDFLIRYGIPQS